MNPEHPFHGLAELPRGAWLPSLVCGVGHPDPRLTHVAHWLAQLQAGRLPDSGSDFGDAAALEPMREALGQLGLPGLCAHTPALAEQVLRTVLWHLDRVADGQPRLSRSQAVAQAAQDFHAEWQPDTSGLEPELRLLRDLGDFAHLQWDQLLGRLRSRPWAEARHAAQRLEQMPELRALIAALGRAEHSPEAPPAHEQAPRPQAGPKGWRTRDSHSEDAPGEITGIRLTGRIESMLPAEAAALRHPVLRKLWRARQAEARLLGWATQARFTHWVPDPSPARFAPQARPPAPAARGPILVCLDTSGSMRGAPEAIAKAVVIAALRAAHASNRACRLLAFGGLGEVLEQDLSAGLDGLDALLSLMERSFDGGTDLQTPIARAIASVREAAWQSADILLVSDGEFGCVPHTLQELDAARAELGLRVQGVLVGDRETMGLLEVCDAIHWVRDWRRHGEVAGGESARGFSPVHTKSLTALFFPNALSPRAARTLQGQRPQAPTP